MAKQKIAFHTLGCKLNYSETSAISRLFDELEYEIVSFKQEADFYIINTCAVTGAAEKKCKTLINAAHRRNNAAHIALIGCFSELKSNELSQINGVDIVLGSANKFSLPNKINELLLSKKGKITEIDSNISLDFHSSWSLGERTRSFLKIQDGCDYHCSYCTVCIARGESRSDTIEHVIENVNQIVASGIKEVILTGVNIGDFGRKNKETFHDLLVALEKIEGLKRVRISSIEPNLLTNEIIELVSKSKIIMPHFHIPLQSGCDKILGLMKRRYKREVFAERVNFAKKKIQNCFIAADVIVGFPSETDEDFNETYNFINSLDISELHVFSYSVRPNTTAAEMKEQINDKVKQYRSKKLHELSANKKNIFYKKYLSKEMNVLFESTNNHGFINGFTENYIKCQVPYNKNFINEIIKVKLDSFIENSDVINCNLVTL